MISIKQSAPNSLVLAVLFLLAILIASCLPVMAAEREQIIDATAREPVHDAAEPVPVRIAIIDTGIATAAIAENNLDKGHNYIHSAGGTEDTFGHGTAVASLIVGSTSAGVTGLAPDALLVPLVYYSKTGDAQTAKGDLAMLAQSIRDAVDVYDCRIINISSGAKVDTPTLRDAVAWAEQCDALAAGLGEHYYTDAVAWADTQGFFTVAQTAFSSAQETSRATIATYLHHNHEQR